MIYHNVIKPASGTGQVQSVVRALGLLECVVQQGEIGVSELARRNELHVATASNLLRTLTSIGYLVNDGGKYRIGPAVARLAGQWSPAAALPPMVEAGMQKMSEATGETGSLGILVGHRCEIIPISQGAGEIIASSQHTVSNYPLALASGRVMVALGSESLQESAIRKHVQDRRDMSISRWVKELQSVGEYQCAIIRRPGDGCADALAVPVYDANDQPLASLGARCPNFRSTKKHLTSILRHLHAAADDVNRQLGGQRKKVPTSLINKAIEHSFQ